jgi:serine/threonine-protein kinase
VYFDKFRVIDALGQGGTSEVYLAENIKVGNKWAIKRARKDNHNINLLAEPNILKHLNHRAIPKIIDIEEDEEAIYIIEEYVEGTNLKDYKKQCSEIETSQVIHWAFQLCDVLKYLHQRKPHPIIYRDVKPDNIMLMDDGNIKLIDFGIAREYKEESQNDTMPIGTKGYAAPEQYGIGQSDERTDIYSLGITIYYLLTSKNLSLPPYKIQWTEQLNTELANELFEIVLKCCEILPNLRFQNIEELEKALLGLDNNKIENTLEKYEYINYSNKMDSGGEKSTNEITVKRTVTIGFLGVSKGVGVTHSSIMFAQILSKKGKVALIELNDSKHFKEIGFVTVDEKAVEKKNFIYNRVHYFWDIDYWQFLTLYRDKYDFILLDLGSYQVLGNIDEFIRADIRIVVGQGMDWKVKEIKSFYTLTRTYDPNNNWYYLLPFMDQKSIKEIKGWTKSKTFHLPYNMNPFIPGQEIKKAFEQVLKT